VKQTIPSQALIRSREKRDARLKADPTCSKCGKTKTFGDFPKGCVDYWCIQCRSDYSLKLYHKRQKALSGAEKEADRQRQRVNREKRLARMLPGALAKFRSGINAKNIAVRNGLRDKVYAAYGGYKCACCGETTKAFLSIDHVYNNGAAHRRFYSIKTGEQLYRWLIRESFPEGFQVLCMNCQWGKRNNGGICPHVSEKV
jgi:hypothetical protein